MNADTPVNLRLTPLAKQVLADEDYISYVRDIAHENMMMHILEETINDIECAIDLIKSNEMSDALGVLERALNALKD